MRIIEQALIHEARRSYYARSFLPVKLALLLIDNRWYWVQTKESYTGSIDGYI